MARSAVRGVYDPSPQRETEPDMQTKTLQIEGRPATVHVGGREGPDAEPMVLLHGAWGGAALHWSPIWDRLAERFRVVAPELPGFDHGTEAGPLTVPAFATWLAELLAAVGAERPWFVGHGFGGAVGWQLATRSPERTRGLILLNGGPPPPQPWLLRKFFHLGIARGFVRHALRNGVFGPGAVAHGFADPGRAPRELSTLLARPDSPQLRTLVEAIVRGGYTLGHPMVPVMMLWGENDSLPGTDGGAMDRLVNADNPPRFETIPDAGHLPQLEKPAEVVERILTFTAAPA